MSTYEYVRPADIEKESMRIIEAELKERGIERDIAQQAIYLFEDEENLDLAELEKENAFLEAERYLDDPAPTEKERARAGRRLASLGYDTSLIYHILGRFGRRDLDA